MMRLTPDELRTLIWMCESAYAKRVKYLVSVGGNPSDNPTIKRILEISRQAHADLVEQTMN